MKTKSTTTVNGKDIIEMDVQNRPERGTSIENLFPCQIICETSVVHNWLLNNTRYDKLLCVVWEIVCIATNNILARNQKFFELGTRNDKMLFEVNQAARSELRKYVENIELFKPGTRVTIQLESNELFK